ncbi:MAG: hypothetical protein IBJ01_17810 [Leptospira sp.]|uniref:hypothetical protein n=1 Tax=Leptospira sp. TaxID=178 RepID=UPI0025C279C3|nr:hypothetical protein [Leptospira sp.]MBL0956616.1 hypothetical protein [Leptospira sp.]
MKFKIFIFLIITLNFQCKEKGFNHKEEEDPFFLNSDSGCIINTEIENECLNKKEELSCYQILSELKNSKLEKIFFGKVWMGEDHQTLFYIVDSKGNIKIFEGGPDKLPNQRKLVGHGRFYIEDKKWFYEQSCNDNNCESVNIPLVYLHCSLSKSSNNLYVLNNIEFGNRKFIEDDVIEKDDKYKLISFTQEQPIKNQVFNGFISTKVPPIPEKR